jgi:hypothetical protein
MPLCITVMEMFTARRLILRKEPSDEDSAGCPFPRHGPPAVQLPDKIPTPDPLSSYLHACMGQGPEVGPQAVLQACHWEPRHPQAV